MLVCVLTYSFVCSFTKFISCSVVWMGVFVSHRVLVLLLTASVLCLYTFLFGGNSRIDDSITYLCHSVRLLGCVWRFLSFLLIHVVVFFTLAFALIVYVNRWCVAFFLSSFLFNILTQADSVSVFQSDRLNIIFIINIVLCARNSQTTERKKE